LKQSQIKEDQCENPEVAIYLEQQQQQLQQLQWQQKSQPQEEL